MTVRVPIRRALPTITHGLSDSCSMMLSGKLPGTSVLPIKERRVRATRVRVTSGFVFSIIVLLLGDLSNYSLSSIEAGTVFIDREKDFNGV